MKNNAKKLTQAAMIAGLYAAVTFATFFMSFGAVQYRVSEALTILPWFLQPRLYPACRLAAHSLISLDFLWESIRPAAWTRYSGHQLR